MATMTFLANFNGNANYTAVSGSGTLSTGGSVTYDDGFFPGKQGAVVETGDWIHGPEALRTAITSETTGAIAIRFRRDVDAGGHQNLINMGLAGGGAGSEYLVLRIDNGDRFDFSNYKDAAIDAQARVAAAAPTGEDRFGYVDWTATTIRAYIIDTWVTDATRTTPGTFATSLGNVFNIGAAYSGGNAIQGMIDCIAFFDGPLTDDEVTFIEDRAVPWTWQMPLSNDPPVVDAGPNDSVVQFVAWTQAGSFTDADSASWTATVDYDDGDGEEALTLDGTTFELSHTWTTTGSKTVTVAVTDDNGEIGTDTVTVTVVEGLLTGSFIVSTVAGTHPTAPHITLG